MSDSNEPVRPARTPEQLAQDAGDLTVAVINHLEGRPIREGVTCDTDHLLGIFADAWIGLVEKFAVGDPHTKGLVDRLFDGAV